MAVEIQDLIAHEYLLDCGNRDIEFQDFVMSDVLDVNWRSLAYKAKELVKDHKGNIGIHGPFWGLDISSPDKEVQNIISKRMNQALDVCDYLGATQLVVHSPYSIWSHGNIDPANANPLLTWIIENCHNSLRSAVTRAELLDVTLVIENIQDKSPDMCSVLVDSFQSKSVALSIDTGHAHFTCRSFGGAAVDTFIREAGEKLKHVHLHDTSGCADNHLSIGEGTVCWADTFKTLDKITQMPRLILELNDKNDIMKSILHLQNLKLAR